jgi:hypothetical protein
MLGVAEPHSLAQQVAQHENSSDASDLAPGGSPPHAGGSATSTTGSTECCHPSCHDSFHERSHATSHASSHAGSRATYSTRSPALKTTRIGDTTRVVNGKAEWSQEDFGLAFVRWFAESFPDAWESWIWYPDIAKYYFPRFKAAIGAKHLQLGSFIRGLHAATLTRPMQYTDPTGRRRSTSEYWMGAISEG